MQPSPTEDAAIAYVCRRGQAGGGDLVEQRLEQMVIGAVHHCDSRAAVVETFAEFESAKSRSDNHDARAWLRVNGHDLSRLFMR